MPPRSSAGIALGLDGAGVLVTGGGRGIGRATAQLLAAAGASVAVGYRTDRGAAETLVAGLRGRGARAVAVAADLTRLADAERLVREAVAVVGPLKAVVANAGTWRPTPIADFPLDEWEALLRENLTSKALTVRAALPHCAPDARLVLVASTAGQRGEGGYGAYAASQGGTIALVKSLAAELGPRGIRVNGVAPGWVRTDMSRAAIGAREAEIVAGHPVGRVAEPEDVAGPIVFLCSALARHVHGEILNVNGGSVLCG